MTVPAIHADMSSDSKYRTTIPIIMGQIHHDFMRHSLRLLWRRPGPGSRHQYCCDIAGIGSSHEQTRSALSRHSEGRGHRVPDFRQGDSASTHLIR